MIQDRNALKQARENAEKVLDSYACRILVCSGTGCIATGSEKIYEKFLEITKDAPGVTLEFAPHDEKAHLGVKKTGCQGICELGPLVRIQKGGETIQYTKVQPDDCREIFEKSVLGDEIIERLLYQKGGLHCKRPEDIPFIAKQTRIVLKNCGKYDAESLEDLEQAGRTLMAAGRLHISAGCAGFGAVLPELLGLGHPERVARPELDRRLLVVCGSVNPITLAQLDHAQQAGFARLRLAPRQKLQPGYWHTGEGEQALHKMEEVLKDHPLCIIDSNDAGGNQPTAAYAEELGCSLETMRVRIASSLGDLVAGLFRSPHLGTLLLTGGDTLLQCMRCAGVTELEPVCEMEKGVVLARFTCDGCTRHVITKSGGFGQATLLTDLAARLAAGA